MAINVHLYTLTKRYNSTRQPTGDGTVLSCSIKSPSSIINPRLELKTDPTAYNYCYIPAFSRYYFISDITFNTGLWICQLTEDVLASYKTAIGSSSLYVLRASAAHDEYVRDTLFPTKAKMTKRETVVNDTLFSWDDGVYIVNVLSGSGGGAVSYQLTPANFATFYRNLATAIDGLDWSDVPKALLNGFTNPQQYITSCFWFPRAFAGTDVTAIPLGITNISVPAKRVTGMRYTVFNPTLPKHPKAGTYGKYVNAAPFSRYTLTCGPLGEVALDASQLVDSSTFSFSIWEDSLTGQAVIRVPGSTYTVGWGVPVALGVSQANTGGLLAGIGAVAAAAGTGGLSEVVGIAGGLAGAAESTAGTTSTISSAGSIAGHNNMIILHGYFYDIVDRDVDNLGMPLCQIRTPAALGGYIMVQNGSINAAATAGELASIKGYLEGGFYYE